MWLKNPHDKFFKETFGDVMITKDFLTNYLPDSLMEIIDVNTLEPEKDSFINDELKESYSDLLFKVNIFNQTGYLYFLFEHKSYIYNKTILQLLKYIIEIWEAKSEKEKSNELPIVIPLVIYHGQKNWNIGLNLTDLIKGYGNLTPYIQRLVPNFEYLLYDLSKYKDEDIKGDAQLQIVLTTLRDIFTKDSKDLLITIYRAVKFLRELEDHQTGIRYFETLLRYIFSAGKNLTKSEVVDMMKEIEMNYPEGRDVVMTLAEQYIEEGKKQGLKQGIEKGIEKGIEEGKKQVAVNLIKEGMEYSYIEKLTGLTREEIEDIAAEIRRK